MPFALHCRGHSEVLPAADYSSRKLNLKIISLVQMLRLNKLVIVKWETRFLTLSFPIVGWKNLFTIFSLHNSDLKDLLWRDVICILAWAQIWSWKSCLAAYSMLRVGVVQLVWKETVWAAAMQNLLLQAIVMATSLFIQSLSLHCSVAVAIRIRRFSVDWKPESLEFVLAAMQNSLSNRLHQIEIFFMLLKVLIALLLWQSSLLILFASLIFFVIEWARNLWICKWIKHCRCDTVASTARKMNLKIENALVCVFKTLVYFMKNFKPFGTVRSLKSHTRASRFSPAK